MRIIIALIILVTVITIGFFQSQKPPIPDELKDKIIVSNLRCETEGQLQKGPLDGGISKIDFTIVNYTDSPLEIDLQYELVAKSRIVVYGQEPIKYEISDPLVEKHISIDSNDPKRYVWRTPIDAPRGDFLNAEISCDEITFFDKDGFELEIIKKNWVNGK